METSQPPATRSTRRLPWLHQANSQSDPKENCPFLALSVHSSSIIGRARQLRYGGAAQPLHHHQARTQLPALERARQLRCALPRQLEHRKAHTQL